MAHHRQSQAAKRPPKTRKRASSSARDDGVRSDSSTPVILTIGHSTRPITEFIRLLKAHAVTRVVDVRTVPRSRHNPQFSQENLPSSLRASGIEYLHCPLLGGLRRTTPDSRNTRWRNLSFRGYADYMQTPEFASAVEAVIQLAARDRLALMCAEAVPWRCHRSLIADALLVRGITANEISSAVRLTPHRLTPFAQVRGTKITYPSERPPPRYVAVSRAKDAAPRRSKKPSLSSRHV